MIVRHFNQAIFLVTLYEMKSFGDRLGKIIREGGNLVVLLTAEDLVDHTSVTQSEAQISEILSEYETILSYVMFPTGSVIPNAIRSIFSSNPNITEVQPTIEFTTAEMNLERTGETFGFNGIVLVDLTITNPMPLLFALETKLELQEREPITFQECIIGCPASETENQKNENFLQILDTIRQDTGHRTRNVLVNRLTIFEDSLANLINVAPTDLKGYLLRIEFIGEEGFDAGGLLKEWYSLIIKEVFDPNRALFQSLETNQNAFVPDPRSVDFDHFKFVGRLIGKAIIDKVPIECRLSRLVYKLMLGRSLTLFDLKEIDPASHQSISWIAKNPIEGVMDDLTFTVGTGDDFGGVHQEIELISGRCRNRSHRCQQARIHLLKDSIFTLRFDKNSDGCLP